MYLGKKPAFLPQWQLLNCRERGFRKGGKQEIWRVWTKLFSAQGEMIQNRSSLQLFGATGKSSGMKMVNSYSIFPLWGWHFQGQGNSSDGSAAIASAVAHGSSARSSPCARRDICSGWTGGRNLSLPFFLHWFSLGKVWISPSFSGPEETTGKTEQGTSGAAQQLGNAQCCRGWRYRVNGCDLFSIPDFDWLAISPLSHAVNREAVKYVAKINTVT